MEIIELKIKIQNSELRIKNGLPRPKGLAVTFRLSLRGTRKSDVAIQKGNNEIESHTDLFRPNGPHLETVCEV